MKNVLIPKNILRLDIHMFFSIINYSESMFDFIPGIVISFKIPQEEFNTFTGVNILPNKGLGKKQGKEN